MIYILFHSKKVSPFIPCHDGLFAGFAAKLAMPDAKLVPAMYGHPPQLSLGVGDIVYLLDLTYPAPVLEGWSDQGATVQVIDHHKQAMQDLSCLSDRVLREFDMHRSGAVMAWEFFHPIHPIPLLFLYVQDRDLWTKVRPNCDLVHFGLADLFDGKPFESCLQVIEDAVFGTLMLETIIEQGAAVQTEIETTIRQALARAQMRNVLGHRVPMFLCQTKREKQAYSDIGNALVRAYPDCPFAVVQTGDGWALRSDGFDVALIAKQIGGGGHVCASGAKAELPYWIEVWNERLMQLFQPY